jgi:Zn-dependent peptidase ImmA (M78 family)
MAISKNVLELTKNFVNNYINIDTPLPIDIADIIKKETIQVEERYLEDELSGLLIIHGDAKLIGVEQSHSPVRKRFTLAHELGHYVLHSNDSKMFVDTAIFKRQIDGGYSSKEERMEREANNFAANILMPEILVYREVRNFYKDLNDENNIAALAQKFEVSTAAMTFRLINLSII